MLSVELVTTAGARFAARFVDDDGTRVDATFDELPSDHYQRLEIDGVPVIGFRYGPRFGRHRFVVEWKPAIVEQTPRP